ncbi:MAG: acetyl esterase/lipase [Rhodothermales bacterium]|jgi:acetyl esterase/lipase
MPARLFLVFLFLASCVIAADYKSEIGITYSEVDGLELKLNAFVPESDSPTPAIVHIHGGWWTGGGPSKSPKSGQFSAFRSQNVAIFSIQYRLGKKGGFPENIRDCRNAVRFVRKHAARFNIDPDRIGAMGGSAGGHLTMMVTLAPADFDDGGPTAGLEGISPAVCMGFPWIGPTDMVRQWHESVEGARNNAKPYHRVLFHGVIPEDEAGRAEYRRMSPMTYARENAPPLLICDGEKDPIVPDTPGKNLHEALEAAGAYSVYWLTKNGGHGYPGGAGFKDILDAFVKRTLIDAKSSSK